MIITRFILTILLLFTLVSCRGGRRGDQGPPKEEQDFIIDFGSKVDILDENFQEMTPENTQIVASERINEDDVDGELATAEKHASYPAWKIVLVVAGCALGLVLVVVAVILVIKSRNNVKEDEVRSKDDKDEDSEASAISRLGRKLEDNDIKKDQERLTLIDQIRFRLVENIPE